VPRSPSPNGGPSTLFPCARAFLARQENLRPAPLRNGRKRCGLIAPRPVDRHRGREGRGPSTDKETYHHAHRQLHQERERLQRADQDGYTGTIRTLSLDIKVRLVPAESLRTRRRRTCACWQPTMSRSVQRESGLEGEHRLSLGEARRPLLPGTDLRQPRRRRRRSRPRLVALIGSSPQGRGRRNRRGPPRLELCAALAKRPETRRSQTPLRIMSNTNSHNE
jgi:hypothetical protein